MPRITVRVAAVLMLASSLAACAGSPGVNAVPRAEAVLGVTWELTSWPGHDLAPLERPLTVMIQGDRLSSSGPCNQVTGNAKLSGATLLLGPLLATKRHCGPAMALEDAWLAALGGTLTLSQPAPARLVVTGADGSRLEFRAAP